MITVNCQNFSLHILQRFLQDAFITAKEMQTQAPLQPTKQRNYHELRNLGVLLSQYQYKSSGVIIMEAIL